MRCTKQGVITTAEKAGCTVEFDRVEGMMFIVAPEGMIFPDGTDRIVAKEWAPEYDEIYPAIEGMVKGRVYPVETYGDFGPDDLEPTEPESTAESVTPYPFLTDADVVGD